MSAKNTCLKFLIKPRPGSYLHTHNREYSGHSLVVANLGDQFLANL